MRRIQKCGVSLSVSCSKHRLFDDIPRLEYSFFVFFLIFDYILKFRQYHYSEHVVFIFEAFKDRISRQRVVFNIASAARVYDSQLILWQVMHELSEDSIGSRFHLHRFKWPVIYYGGEISSNQPVLLNQFVPINLCDQPVCEEKSIYFQIKSSAIVTSLK